MSAKPVTPDPFAKRLRQLSRDIEARAEERVRAAALAVAETLVRATPVDTGRARANWLTSLEAPRTDCT